MIGILLGVLGVIITLGFGAYSIWAYEKSKRTVSLEFENKECYSLFRDDVNRLNIELSYNKQPISNGLILLKARINNNGKVDIDKSRVYSPLKIISSEKFKWLEFTITPNTNGALTKAKLNNPHEFQIEWDLLKKNEFIEIEALVEIVNNSSFGNDEAVEFYNELVFDCRITDLNKVQKENQLPESLKRKESKSSRMQILGIGAFFSGLTLLTVFTISSTPEYRIIPLRQIINFSIIEGGKERIGHISANNSDGLTLRVGGVDEVKELSVREFNEQYKIQEIKQVSIDPKEEKFNLIFGIIYTFLGASMFIYYFFKKKKLKRASA